MQAFSRLAFSFTLFVALVVEEKTQAGTITTQVVEDKGTVAIPNGHFEHVFKSHMSLTLGPEWGDLAGHFERNNNEQLVWVNTGPPIVLHFANVYPKEVDVPENPKPNKFKVDSFFDIFVELDPNNLQQPLKPLEPNMSIQPGPNTNMEGAFDTLIQGTVTPISDLSQLPTSNANDTNIVWDLSQFSSTTGNFFLIEYDVPNAFVLTGVAEPSTLLLAACGALGAAGYARRRKAAHPTYDAPVSSGSGKLSWRPAWQPDSPEFGRARTT